MQVPPTIASTIEKSAPLLDPERVPDGVAIAYGPRIYWRDPTTGKVFWAQKSFLNSLLAQMQKPQASVTVAVKSAPLRAPEAAVKSASAQPSDSVPAATRPTAAAAAPEICGASRQSADNSELIKSAAQVETGIGVCGGARIADDLVITNGHCLIGPDAGWAKVKSLKGRESNMKARFIVEGRAHNVRCGQVMALSPFQKARGGRDFAIVRCSGIPDEVPVMRITETEPVMKETVTMATWDWPRRGVPSRLASGPVIGNEDSYLFARFKIVDGNSGSMVVNGNQEIVGVANGAGEGPVAGSAFFHSMKAIMRQLKEQSPEAYEEIREASNAGSTRCMASAPARAYSDARQVR